MGCDIHAYVELKIDGKWVLAEEPQPNPYYEKYPDSERKTFLPASYDPGRSYRLFAMLAGVRNGVGFANVKTGDPIEPISEPRGVPEDVCSELKAEIDSWDGDGHSHSWLTLAELDKVPWEENKITSSGMVDPYGYHEWETKGIPSMWCGDVLGEGVRHVSNEKMAALIKEKGVPEKIQPWGAGHWPDSPEYYTRVDWTRTWEEAVPQMIDIMARLAMLAEERGLEHDAVRYTFFFDN